MQEQPDRQQRTHHHEQGTVRRQQIIDLTEAERQKAHTSADDTETGHALTAAEHFGKLPIITIIGSYMSDGGSAIASDDDTVIARHENAPEASNVGTP